MRDAERAPKALSSKAAVQWCGVVRHCLCAGVDERVAQFVRNPDASWYRTYIHADRQNSVTALSDAAGAVVRRRAYGAYGETDSAQMAEHVFGYTGRRWQADMGLYYYRARWYDPELGTLLQPDPIGSRDYINLYAYVGLEPGNATDPTGLYACKGSEQQCAGLDRAVDRANRALEKMDPNSQEHREMSSTLQYIGRNDGKGLVIAFGKLAPGVMGSASGSNQITLDENNVRRSSSMNESLNPSLSKADTQTITLAGTVVHEGRHVRDINNWFLGRHPSTKNDVEALERTAYTTQQSYFRAENFNSSLTPRGATATDLQNAVERGVNLSVSNWCAGMANAGRGGASGC